MTRWLTRRALDRLGGLAYARRLGAAVLWNGKRGRALRWGLCQIA